MNLDNEERDSADRLESEGITKMSSKRSKIAYTREFLLSSAELDVCKQFPRGFESSVLRELEDASKGILELSKKSGVLSSRSSGNSECTLLESTKVDSGGNYQESGRISGCLSSRLNRKSNSQEVHFSDFKRHIYLSQCLLKASGCKPEVTGQKVQEIKKDGFYQLSRSENPYRPPHSEKVGGRKFEVTSLPKKTVSMKKMECAGQENKQLQGYTISGDEEHENKSSTVPLTDYNTNPVNVSFAEENSRDPVDVVRPSLHTSNSSEANVASGDEIKCFDSEKVSMSAIRGDFNEEHSLMILKEQVGTSLKVGNGCSSTVTEMSIPPPLTANAGLKLGLPGKLSVHKIEDSCSLLTDSSEDNNCNSEINQSDEPTSETKLNALLGTGEFYSAQRGSFNRISRTDISEPYEFSIPIAYRCFTSVFSKPEMEENESTFDDLWSEIFAAIQLEQELDLAPVAQCDQTAGFEVQDCLPDEDSLISFDYPTSSVHSKFLPLNSSNDVTNSYSGIGLHDENSLISVDDLIASHYLKLKGDGSSMKDKSLTSDVKDEVAKQQGALAISKHQEGSDIHGLEIPPFLHLAAPMAYVEAHFQPSFLLNHPYTGIHPEMPALHRFNSPEVQTGLPTTFMDPMTIHCFPALHYYTCTNMLHRPSKKIAPSMSRESNSLVRYSLYQQPFYFRNKTTTLQNAARVDPMNYEVACGTCELERGNFFP